MGFFSVKYFKLLR